MTDRLRTFGIDKETKKIWIEGEDVHWQTWYSDHQAYFDSLENMMFIPAMQAAEKQLIIFNDYLFCGKRPILDEDVEMIFVDIPYPIKIIIPTPVYIPYRVKWSTYWWTYIKRQFRILFYGRDNDRSDD